MENSDQLSDEAKLKEEEAERLRKAAEDQKDVETAEEKVAEDLKPE